MGFFYKYKAASMVSDFAFPDAGKLTPYTAVVFFSSGVLLSNFLFNYMLMRNPLSANRLTYTDYFKGSVRDHATGFLGGIIWCMGMSFSILASDKAGAAISYGLGQGATVIAALWGIFVWKEFQHAPKKVNVILKIMLCLYVAGLFLIVLAR